MNKHLLKEVNELYPEKSNKLVDFIYFEMNKDLIPHLMLFDDGYKVMFRYGYEYLDTADTSKL